MVFKALIVRWFGLVLDFRSWVVLDLYGFSRKNSADLCGHVMPLHVLRRPGTKVWYFVDPKSGPEQNKIRSSSGIWFWGG